MERRRYQERQRQYANGTVPKQERLYQRYESDGAMQEEEMDTVDEARLPRLGRSRMVNSIHNISKMKISGKRVLKEA